MKKRKRKENGVTLVSLGITIVVLMILARDNNIDVNQR